MKKYLIFFFTILATIAILALAANILMDIHISKKGGTYLVFALDTNKIPSGRTYNIKEAINAIAKTCRYRLAVFGAKYAKVEIINNDKIKVKIFEPYNTDRRIKLLKIWVCLEIKLATMLEFNPKAISALSDEGKLIEDPKFGIYGLKENNFLFGMDIRKISPTINEKGKNTIIFNFTKEAANKISELVEKDVLLFYLGEELLIPTPRGNSKIDDYTNISLVLPKYTNEQVNGLRP